MIVLIMTLTGIALGQWGGCINEFRARQWTIEGRVMDVYYDQENRFEATIEVRTSQGIKKWSLLGDQEALISVLDVGDSVRKVRKSIVMDVFRNDQTVSIPLTFDCN